MEKQSDNNNSKVDLVDYLSPEGFDDRSEGGQFSPTSGSTRINQDNNAATMTTAATTATATATATATKITGSSRPLSVLTKSHGPPPLPPKPHRLPSRGSTRIPPPENVKQDSMREDSNSIQFNDSSPPEKVAENNDGCLETTQKPHQEFISSPTSPQTQTKLLTGTVAGQEISDSKVPNTLAVDESNNLQQQQFPTETQSRSDAAESPVITSVSFEIIFHAILPANASSKIQPVVLGSIPELGNWGNDSSSDTNGNINNKGVLLRQVSGTYWCSSVVQIVLPEAESVVEYKYALQDRSLMSKALFWSRSSVSWEGMAGEYDNRILLYQHKDQFDVWKTNSKYHVDKPDADSGRSFISAIVEMVGPSMKKNHEKDDDGDGTPNVQLVTEAVERYQSLLSQLPRLAKSALTVDFIATTAQAALNAGQPQPNKGTKEITARQQRYMNQQFLFLFIMLAFHGSSRGNRPQLLSQFPSAKMIECLRYFDIRMLPDNIDPNWAVTALAAHNSSGFGRESVEWIRLFPLISVLGKRWMLGIKHARVNDCGNTVNEQDLEIFVTAVKENVIPMITKTDAETRVAILKVLINATRSQAALVFLYINVLPLVTDSLPDSPIKGNRELNGHFQSRLSQILARAGADSLLAHIERMPAELMLTFADVFRQRGLRTLEDYLASNGNIILDTNKATSGFQDNGQEEEEEEEEENRLARTVADLVRKSIVPLPNEWRSFSQALRCIVNTRPGVGVNKHQVALLKQFPALLRHFFEEAIVEMTYDVVDSDNNCSGTVNEDDTAGKSPRQLYLQHQDLSEKVHEARAHCEAWYSHVINIMVSRRADWDALHKCLELLVEVLPVARKLERADMAIADGKQSTLVDIMMERLTEFTERQLFRAAKQIDKLDIDADADIETNGREIKSMYMTLIRCALDTVIKNNGNHGFYKEVATEMLNRVRYVCWSEQNTAVLEISNRFCAEIVIEIISRLETILPPIQTKDAQLEFAIFQQSSFWIPVLMAAERERSSVGQVITASQAVKAICLRMSYLRSMLCSDEISLGHLAEVERYSVKDIVTFFEAAAGAAHQGGGTESSSSLHQKGGKIIIITSEMLNALRETRAQYLKRLKILQTFTQHFGTRIWAINADIVLSNLKARQKAMVTLKLRQATLPNHWDPFTDEVLPAAEESNHLVDAQTFENVLVPHVEQFNLQFPAVKEEALVIPSLVMAASEVVRPAVSEYAQTCRAYANWQQLRLSDVQRLWANVNVDRINRELALIRRTVNIGPIDEDLVDTLTCLIELSDRMRKLNQIIRFMDLFQSKTETSTVIQHATGEMGSDVGRESTATRIDAPVKTRLPWWSSQKSVVKQMDTEVVQEPSLKSSTDFSQQQQLHAQQNELVEWINQSLEKFGSDDKHDLTLKDLHSFTRGFLKISSTMKPDSWHLLHELEGAKKLVAFLKSVEHEDLSNWINAVEDQSDNHYIREAEIVSSLIEVQREIRPFFSLRGGGQSTMQLLQNIDALAQRNPEIVNRLRLCIANMQTLENLQANISKRGEVTKERILHAVTAGSYLFRLDRTAEANASVKMTYSSYRNKSGVETYELVDLLDLRGRALLIVNATGPKLTVTANKDDSGNDYQQQRQYIAEFVKQINLVQEILAIGLQLHEMGHFQYQFFQRKVSSTAEMIEMLDLMHKDMEVWERVLDEARLANYYLNFFRGCHLVTFWNFLLKSSEKNAFSMKSANLLSYVNPKAKFSAKVSSGAWASKGNWQQELDFISQLLARTFDGLNYEARLISENDLGTGGRVLSDVVRAGRLCVAVCNDRLLVPNVLLSLYANHGTVPEPSQILLCSPTTTTEELDLLLRRCFFASRQKFGSHANQLFCIGNVQNLSYERQLILVRSIRRYQFMIQSRHALSDGATKREKEAVPNVREEWQRTDAITDAMNGEYLLSLICVQEAGAQHHILDEFSEFVHSTVGLGAVAMSRIVQKITENKVEVIASDISGQGKTVYIQQQAAAKKTILRPLLIADRLDRRQVAHWLQNTSNESLHITVGNADNLTDLNIFLFELLVLRIVSAGSDIAYLQRSVPFIFIELASNVDAPLLEQLPFVGYLSQIRKLSFSLDRFIVTPKTTDPLRTVCAYLQALHNQVLDRTDISLPPPFILPAKTCQNLMHQYFLQQNGSGVVVHAPSFRLLNTFINMFACQLCQLSESPYFTVDNLNFMRIQHQDIRSTLVRALLNVSKDFALRAVTTGNGTNQIERLNTMTKWTDSNHLLVFFQSQSPGTIVALYRNPAFVPANITSLLKSQHIMRGADFCLDDFSKMEIPQLCMKLEMIARTTHYEKAYRDYALSTDNLLKMALMLLRTRALLPVVLCGEAGCGKTSLIRYLADTVDVKFLSLNLHAGITKDQITSFINEAEREAMKGEVWVFLDEINTCNYLGMLSTFICDRIFDGQPISINIRLFAACNPYRRRKAVTSNDAGLTKQYEEQSPFVYQVHPLPESLLDYIWDYGVLEQEDEYNYILIMTQHNKLWTDLIFESQLFMRQIEDLYSVSLRDVKRAIKFATFFETSLAERKRYPATSNRPNQYPPMGDIYQDIRPYVLSLSLCYQGRLSEHSVRHIYRGTMAKVFKKHKQTLSAEKILEIVRDDQFNFVERMNYPPSTALNEALLENVHAITVCVLTRTPLFIIGSPGTSKSLAMKIVKESMRGLDSNDAYFQTLPQIYVIPHQGSSSSTSEGILKVFEKAKKYQQTSSKRFPVTAVVLLDEVGLAETSPLNPLKVLHSLLEPSLPNDETTVAVVGISNWRLDASKMSRAIRIQRPKPNVHDLTDIVMRLGVGVALEPETRHRVFESLAQAYDKYQQRQRIPNFHGLRDYYSFAKNLGGCEQLTPRSVQFAFARNFSGGEETENERHILFWQFLSGIFEEMEWNIDTVENANKIDVAECIHANLCDCNARHLLVIGNTDIAIDILEYRLRLDGFDPLVIYGSQFPTDQSSNYGYSVLNKILICVEQGRPVILKDLEIIYGSLYDLWNQNYTTVGSRDDPRQFCRVALGEYANPMCFVHPNFRCIVVMDEQTVRKADPPLLNRFEKQRVGLNSIMDQQYNHVVDAVAIWARKISTLESPPRAPRGHVAFDERDMFIGFCGIDTIRSLVHHNYERSPSASPAELTRRCKANLVEIACSESMVRCEKSVLASENAKEVTEWQDIYFKRQRHGDLASFVDQFILEKNEAVTSNSEFNGRVIIKTFSNINTDIKACLDNRIECQVEKLVSFSSEQELQNRIKYFYLESTTRLLVLQCDPAISTVGCMKLARFLIDHHNKEYMNAVAATGSIKIDKYAFIVVHIHRDASSQVGMFQFDFLCGWRQVVIENLARQRQSLSAFLGRSVSAVIREVFPFAEIVAQELQWCLLCIKYDCNNEALSHIRFIMDQLPRNPYLLEILRRKVEQWLSENEQPAWQYQIACNKQQLLLHNSFPRAVEVYVRHEVRKPLAQLIYILERQNTLTTILSLGENDILADNDGIGYDQSPPALSPVLLELCQQMLADDKVMDLSEQVPPRPDVYNLPGRLLQLRFPFSRLFMRKLDNFKELYREGLKQHQQHQNQPIVSESGCSSLFEYSEFDLAFSGKIETHLPLISQHPAFTEHGDLYLDDYLKVALSGYHITSDCRALLRELIFIQLGDGILNPVRLHLHWWKNEEKIFAQIQVIAFAASRLGFQFRPLYGKLTVNHQIVSDVSAIIVDQLRELEYASHPNGEEAAAQWQRTADTFLALCTKICDYEERNVKYELLRFVSDLCSSLVFPLHLPIKSVVKLIDLQMNATAAASIRHEVFPESFLLAILKFLNTIPDCDEKQAYQRSFFAQCLEVVRQESSIKVQIYGAIFQKDPIPLIAPLVHNLFKLFTSEEGSATARLTEITIAVLQQLLKPTSQLGAGFQVVRRSVGKATLNSHLAVLLCDVFQDNFAAASSPSPDSLECLASFLPHAVEALALGDDQDPLRTVCAVALLKALFTTMADCLLEQRDYIFSPQLVNDLNLFLQHPRAHKRRAIVYFLQCVRHQHKASMADLRNDHCRRLKDIFPWITKLDWRDPDEQGNFNAYAVVPGANRVVAAFTRMRFSDESTLLDELLPLHTFHARLGFLGTAANILYLSRFREDWDNGRAACAKWIKAAPDLPAGVRRTLDELIFKRPPQPQSAKNMMKHSVIAHVIVLHASLESDNSPLARYFHNPGECGTDFVLCSPSDENSVALNAITEPTARYKCNCGYIYVIANCTQPGMTSKCPECNNTIGGIGHVLNPGNMSLGGGRVDVNDQRGYIVENSVGIQKTTHSVRQLTPTAYRILHLIEHAIFVVATSAIPNDRNRVQYCLEHIETDWVVLRGLLNVDDETLSLLLHALLTEMEQSASQNVSRLSTSAMRQQWEQYFMSTFVNPLIANIHQTITNYRNRLAMAQAGDSTGYIDHEIEEIAQNNSNISNQPDGLQRLWRYSGGVHASIIATNADSSRGLQAFYNAKSERQLRFPFLRVYFESPENFSLVKHLAPIVRFVKALCARLSHRVTRAEARTMTFARFLEDEAAQGKQAQKNMADMFHHFAEAWNQVRHVITRFQCHDLPSPMEVMTSTMAVAFAVPEPKDESVYLCATLEFLTSLQNNFLHAVAAIPLDGCQSLTFLLCTEQTATTDSTDSPGPATERTAAFPSVRLQDVHESQIITQTWDPEVLVYHQRNLQFGYGLDIEYDLAHVEFQLARTLVFNKVHLDTELDQFAYKREMFQNHMTILDDVVALVPQEPLSRSLAREISDNPKVRQQASDLISELEMLLCFLERTKGGDAEMTILEYCRQWLRLSTLDSPMLRKTVIGILQLKHVLGLYECVEDIVSDISVDFVPERYSCHVPREVLADFLDMVKRPVASAKPERVLPIETYAIALKRFIQRYLTQDGTISPDHPVAYYLEGSSRCWPGGTFGANEDVDGLFPDSLLVKHVIGAFKQLRTPSPTVIPDDYEPILKNETSSEQNTSNQSIRSRVGKIIAAMGGIESVRSTTRDSTPTENSTEIVTSTQQILPLPKNVKATDEIQSNQVYTPRRVKRNEGKPWPGSEGISSSNLSVNSNDNDSIKSDGESKRPKSSGFFWSLKTRKSD